MKKPPLVEIPYTVALGIVRYHVAAELLKQGRRVKDLFDDNNYTPELVKAALDKHQTKIAALQLQ